MLSLSDEILLLIAGHVPRSQLAALCRVSKKLRSIFTPILYQEARLQKGSWESCLAFCERFVVQKNMVQRLYLGRDIVVQQPMPKTIYKDILNAIEEFLHKQRQLRSVYFNGDALGGLLEESDGQAVLELLAGIDTLQEVSLINTDYTPDRFDNRLPPFCNLSKLELLGMTQGHHDRDREVAKILIACPHIRELALSTVGWATEDDIDLLPKLVQHYRSQTKVRLRLRSLRFGYGFLPVESSSVYLPELTDMTLLKTLRLDNDNVCITTVVIGAPVDVKQFLSATNVTSLTAERLSSDIVELIRHLDISGQLNTLSLPRYCNTQPRARMDEENDHWWDDWYGEDGLAEPPQWEPNQMFSEPLEQAGRHWKNVLIGDIFRTEWLDDSILDCIATYSHIETLTLPLHRESWPRFRDDIMPELRHLQQLFLVGGSMAGTYGYPGFAVSDDEIYSSGTSQQEREKLVKQRDEEYAAYLDAFARDVFYANRSRIARGEDYAVLQHLGLGSFVFTCESLSAASCRLATFSLGKDGESRWYQVVLLDADEANAFASIRELNEEIEELRVGGDERGPAW